MGNASKKTTNDVYGRLNPYLQELAGGSLSGSRLNSTDYTGRQLLDMQYNMDMRDQQWAHDKEVTEAQWAHDEEMYLKYQSPQAMMDQYREAGLNPMLLSGESVSAPNVSPAQNSAPDMTQQSAAPADTLEFMVGLAQQLAGLGNVAAGIDNTVAQSRLVRAEAEGQELDNQIKGKYGMDTAAANLNHLVRLGDLAEKEGFIKEGELKWLDLLKNEEWRKLSNEADITAERRANIEFLIENEIKLGEAKIREVEEHINTLIATSNNLDSSSEKNLAEAQKIKETTDAIVRKLTAEGAYTEVQAQEYIAVQLAAAAAKPGFWLYDYIKDKHPELNLPGIGGH